MKNPWKRLSRRTRLRWLVTIIAVFLFIVAHQYSLPQQEYPGDPVRLSYSQFLEKAKKGEIQKARIYEGTVHGSFANQSFVVVIDPRYVKVVEDLKDQKVDITFEEPASYYNLIFIGIILVWAYLMFMGIGPQGQISWRFWESAALREAETFSTYTFNDVAGIDNAVAEVSDIVEFLKNPAKFQKLGGRVPSGVLFIGPPGNGKTHLARVIAGEANVPFFEVSGSDFVEKFVGVGASRVRSLFSKVRKAGQAILFIDEIDAVGSQRNAGEDEGGEEHNRTVNALLTEMDGFNKNSGLVLIGSTNRPDILDRALIRPGRFDRRVVVSQPDTDGFEKIMNIHIRLQKVPLAGDVNTGEVARLLRGHSGATAALVVNEAALFAARENCDSVAQKHFLFAKDKILQSFGLKNTAGFIQSQKREKTEF